MDAVAVIVGLIIVVAGVTWYRNRDNKKGRTGSFNPGNGDDINKPK